MSKEEIKGWKGDKQKATALISLKCQSCKLQIR